MWMGLTSHHRSRHQYSLLDLHLQGVLQIGDKTGGDPTTSHDTSEKDWISIFEPLTEILGLQVRMNVQRKCVEIRMHLHTFLKGTRADLMSVNIDLKTY